MGPKAVTYTPRRSLLRKASVTQYFGLVVCTYHVPISVVIVNKNDATVNQQTISFNKIKHKLVQERNYFQWENDTHKKTKQNKRKWLACPAWTASTYVINQNWAHLYIFDQSQKANKRELSFCQSFFIPIQKNRYSHKKIKRKCWNQSSSSPMWSHIESKGHVFSKTTIYLSKSMWQKHVKPCWHV